MKPELMDMIMLTRQVVLAITEKLREREVKK
jgi:hypothetical protein